MCWGIVLGVTGETINGQLSGDEVVIHRIVDAGNTLVIGEVALPDQGEQNGVLELLIK
jgi:hypothetical protein